MQIRKCERVTVYNTTEVANLNPEKFKNLSIPFEGESDEEFLTYLDENMYELYEVIYEEIDEETLAELSKESSFKTLVQKKTEMIAVYHLC